LEKASSPDEGMKHGAFIMGKSKARLTYEKNHEKQMALKSEIASHYGGKRACCGETIIEFLQLHHSKLDGGFTPK